MKRAFILFWHGLTALLVSIANWFTVVLGMKDNSKYGKFLRRVVGTCFAFLMLVMVIVTVGALCRSAYYRLGINRHLDESYYDTQCISRSVTYYSYYGYDGYLKTSDGRKTIKGIKWIAKPLGNDSLVCYSDGKKRGYFNKYTGEPVIKPQYNHAWIFSERVALVDDNGWIKFIDASGKVVLDPKIPYIPNTEGYVFHNGFCIISNERCDVLGLIDKEGKWVLNPEYQRIEPVCNLWIVENQDGTSVLDSTMNTVIPFVKGKVWVNDEYISVTQNNHVMQRYNLNGEIINDFFINNITHITYESDEVRYCSSKYYNEDGELECVKTDSEPLFVQKKAKCKRYEAESGWFGLMSEDGKVITLPLYYSIVGIGYDLYLCKDDIDEGVILNGKGERVEILKK